MIPTKVLVVDDSATMRALLKHAMSADPGLCVVGEAANTADAREKIKALDPDVITLDIEMPGMNGLEFLDKIMRLRPTPVVMVSNLTAPGAVATLEALEIGAFDCIAKPNSVQGNTFENLPALLRQAASAKRQIALRNQTGAAPNASAALQRKANWPELVTIGSSTGGVEVLIQLMSEFPADCPPTLIVQHLPAAFTDSFSKRLDRACKAHVAEAQNGEALAPGRVYLAPGGRHLTVRSKTGLRCMITDADPVSGHRPSVDVLFHSVAETFGGRATAAILTGMGRDGADGMLAMRKKGARTLAQDEATSLVYGMPRVAFEIGAAEKRVALSRITREIFG